MTLDVRIPWVLRCLRYTWGTYAVFLLIWYLLLVLDDFMKDHTLLYSIRENQRRMLVTFVTAQRSVLLRHDLSNVTYDNALRMQMAKKTYLVGHADDITAFVGARTIDLAQIKLKRVMWNISSWIPHLWPSTILGCVFTTNIIPTILTLRVGDATVETRSWSHDRPKWASLMRQVF